ncbi:MAG: DNA recombination protein RmuC [Oscillospiraceae bacterium]|nr:DNA recombination protein RmuC [Oscillospiraceae bacterium]
MEILLVIFNVLLLILCGIMLYVILTDRNKKSSQEEQQKKLMEELREINRQAAMETQRSVVDTMNTMGQSINSGVRQMGDSVVTNIQTMNTAMGENQRSASQNQLERLESMEKRLRQLEERNEQRMDALRGEMKTSMQEMRQENTRKLEEIRGTVDEKLQETLQKRITDSFETVSRQLEQVYKGLGEMQHLASDVGGLKQVLSGVKTRGILGEIQLGAILEEILSPEQYETNVATIPGSRERVEYAIRLPGDGDKPVYLPVDAKFPGDTYMHLQEAQASGDPVLVEEARKALITVLKKSAKDIRDKYVAPPDTTTFGIMFLPFEGLYAEAVNLGMIEQLQREYGINVAGPSTMAALLNSLQMGFRTLAIQKRSNEVWQVLGAVKTEFGKFEDVMLKMQNHLRQTSDDLENLMGTRTRAINRKLRAVQELETGSGEGLLEE